MIYNSNIKNFYIRDAVSSDVKQILSFIKGIAKYEKLEHLVLANEEKILDSIFVNGHAKVLLAIYNDLPVGMALYFFNYSTFIGGANLYLEDLFIEHEYRNKGFGKELFRVLGIKAIENNCYRLDFVCLNWNEPSLNFYKKMGAKALNEWVLHRFERKEIEELAKGEKHVKNY